VSSDRDSDGADSRGVFGDIRLEASGRWREKSVAEEGTETD